jgi:hypothetical protein
MQTHSARPDKLDASAFFGLDAIFTSKLIRDMGALKA